MAKPDNPSNQLTIEAIEGEDEAADESTELTKDELFHVLQNERRRRVLQYMLAHGNERYEMSDIAEQVSAWEHDTTVRQLSSDERQRVYIALYQSHLPKLDKVGFIDYNQKRGIVEETPLINQTAPHLDRVDEATTADASPTEAEAEAEDEASDPFSAAGVASLVTGGLGAALLSMAVSVSSVVLAGLVGLLSVTLLGVLIQQLTVASP